VQDILDKKFSVLPSPETNVTPKKAPKAKGKPEEQLDLSQEAKRKH